jgi:predicted acetyltransferase
MKIVEGVALVGEAYYAEDYISVLGSDVSGRFTGYAGKLIAKDLGVKNKYVLDMSQEISSKLGESYFDAIYNPIPEKTKY